MHQLVRVIDVIIIEVELMNNCSYEDELHAREPAYKRESAAIGAPPPRQCERISTITTKNVSSHYTGELIL
jgi:hypothetical protein